MTKINRKCCETKTCNVEYKFYSCDITDIQIIFQKNNHSHLIKSSYVNTRGVDQFFHDDLFDFINKNIFKAKTILIDFTKRYGKQIRVNDNNEIVDLDRGVGDLIPVPSYGQIRSFVHMKFFFFSATEKEDKK